MSEVRGLVSIGVGIILLGLFSTGAGATGEPAGIGIQTAIQDGWLTILRVTDGAPAARAGLRPGDRIVKINGQSTRDMPLADAVQRLIGPAGTSVALTIQRREGDTTTESDVTLTRASLRSTTATMRGLFVPTYTPTKESQRIEWHGNKIVSRVLPYPDLSSLLLRLPLAHAVATGQGIKAAIVQRAGGDGLSSTLQHTAPRAKVHNYTLASHGGQVRRLVDALREDACRVVVVPDADYWPAQEIVALARVLLSEKSAVVVPSDLSEDPNTIDTINELQSMGVLTVGRLSDQSIVMESPPNGTKPLNRRIRKIRTDVFSAVGSWPYPDPRIASVTAAGVAALVLERWPDVGGAETRRKIVEGARTAWQGTSIETGQWSECTIDPVTTQYTPTDEKAIFRFRTLDAAGALEVDTEIPWFLNMLNCHKAWEVTKGKGAVVAVTDAGFHLRHPDLVGHVKATRCFGPRTFESPDQHFHGTEMSRLVLAIAPEAQILPLLCSPLDLKELTPNIAQSFEFAAEQKADVISSSWSAHLNKNEEFLAAVRRAANQGVVVSWFHYPEPYPGILRPDFAYSWWREESRVGFSDRFLVNPPEFHPIEIEAGLSNTAPQAAGLAALVKSVNPALTPREVERLIFDNSDLVGKMIRIPDAYRIVQAARKKTPSP